MQSGMPLGPRRRHPLTAAGTALEHLLFKHFGLELSHPDAQEKAPKRGERT